MKSKTLILFLLCFNFVEAQDWKTQFAYEVKQIDEFIERFNGAENTLIKEYLKKEGVETELLREQLILSLFDLKGELDTTKLGKFIRQVTNSEKPIYLNFYDKDWYAKLKCDFIYKGKKETVWLILQNQSESDKTSKWVISSVIADFLNFSNQNDSSKFLSPISHGLDFLPLSRALKDTSNLKNYIRKDFQMDELSAFIFAIQSGDLKYQSIEKISYHFLQIDGWIVEIHNFQRQDLNAGWLISNLQKANVLEKINYKNIVLNL